MNVYEYDHETTRTLVVLDKLSQEAIKIQVIIQVTDDVAIALLQHGVSTAESRELLNIAEDFSVLLEPMHPGVEDPHLVQYYMIEVPNSTIAKQIITHLRQSRAVEAAYIKPPDEMP